MQDAKIKAEAELLLGRQLRNSLRMLKFKGQAFLLLQRVFLLFFTIKCLVLFPIDVHTFKHIWSFLNAHFHVDILKGVWWWVILNCEEYSEILACRYLAKSWDVVEGTVCGDRIVRYVVAIGTKLIPLLVSELVRLLRLRVVIFLNV